MTQQQQVLAYLKRRGSITQMQAYYKLPNPCTRLASVIKRLKTGGKRIKTVIIRDGKKNYAKYFLK